MKDALIWFGVMGGGCYVGLLLENRKERKAMKARHDKRFKEIQENNKRRRGEL